MQTANHTTKYDLIETFVEALNEFQRKSTSLSSLSSSQYKELMENVEKMGGWKSILALTKQQGLKNTHTLRPFKKQEQKLFKKVTQAKKIAKKKR